MKQEIIYTPSQISQGELYLMRGLPGSGKSTAAREIGEAVFSTDDFFMEDGIYQFDPKKIGEAHKWNQERTKDAITSQVPEIIIDNTNTTCWEMKYYATLGKNEEYSIILAEPDTDWAFNPEVLFGKNSHGVPMEAIERMKNRFESNITLSQILNSKAPWEK